MKRLALLVALGAMAALANAAMAGDYHVGRLLVCADCHTPHASMQHGYGSDADTTGVPTTPYPYLLRGGETVSNTCLNCHDSKAGIPDVLQAPTDVTTNGRSAGALNVPTGGMHGKTTVAPYSEGDGHTLWSTRTPPGYVAPADPDPPLVSTEGLECSDCHHPHGNKYFRNLRGGVAGNTQTFYNDAWKGTELTYEIATTPTQPPSVWVLEKSPHGYDNDNVQYLEKADQQTSEYGKWCATCHKNFHGNETAGSPVWDGTEFVRHPTAGVDIGTSVNRWANANPTHRLKVMSQTGAWAADSATVVASATNLTPSCFSCHKSHGNANKFGLIFVLPSSGSSAPAGSPAALIDPARVAMSEQGDGGEVRDMCRNCHGMGSWPSGNPTGILP